MAKFIESKTTIEGLYVIERKPISDQRGYFERLFCPRELRVWKGRPVSQINRSHTRKIGSIRGMHYQMFPHLDAKLISCIRGRVLDVALDLRYNSSTFGEFFVIELSEDANTSILLPEGLAHGFQALSPNVEMLYMHSGTYVPSSEAGVNVFDPKLSIPWRLECTDISERDLQHPGLSEIEAIKV